MSTIDPREDEWIAHSAAALKRGECPHSGLRLSRDGEGLPGTLSCGVCDCFGFDRSISPPSLWTKDEHVVTRHNDHYYKCEKCGQAGSERWAILHQFPASA